MLKRRMLILLGVLILIACYGRKDGSFNYNLAKSKMNYQAAQNVTYQIILNSPDYISEFYRYVSEISGLDGNDQEQLLTRKVNFSQKFLWFNITARAASMEELCWNECDQFYLTTDRGGKFTPQLVGMGSYPKYRPMEVDGHIYDRNVWEKSFGIQFSNSLLCEKNDYQTIMLVCSINQTVLGAWDVERLRKYYEFDEIDCK